MEQAVIETSRLTFREFTMTDKDAVHLYASDPLVVQYMEWGPNSEADTTRFLEQAAQNQSDQPRLNYELALILKSEGTLIGACRLNITESNSKEASLGYCLNRGFWGQGYATEAAKAIIDFGFKDLKLHRIYATCDPANLASAKVLEKIRMTREGLLREHKLQKGQWRSSLIYSILEWEYAMHEAALFRET